MAVRLTATTNGTVRYGAMSDLNNLAAPISIAAWIRPITLGGSSFARILAKETTGAGYLLYLGSANSFQFAVIYSTSNLNAITNNNVLTVGTTAPWQHVASTWEGGTSSLSVKLYLNGNLMALNANSTNASGSRTNDSAGNLEIGNRTTGSRGFNGDIADVGLWNKVLTAEEIRSLARGFSCKYIGSEQRLFSAPLIRSFNPIEREIGITTVDATVTTHPRIII